MPTGPANIPTCCCCPAIAVHITHHERANTGLLTAYWCDRHFIANQRPTPTDDATVEPEFPVTCPHGRHVGWARPDDPATITNRRFCVPCAECQENDR